MTMKIFKSCAFAFACFAVLHLSLAHANEEESKLNLLADSVADQILVIKESAQLYYIDKNQWPRTLLELKNLGYLPVDFEAKTQWGEEFTLAAADGELSVDIKLPEPEQLVDLIQVIKSFDAVSQAEKQLSDEQAFADDVYAQSSTAVVERTDALGEESFDKKANTDDSQVVKSLTITNDEEYLDAARLSEIPKENPVNYLRISISDDSGQAEIITNQDIIKFNRGATISGNLVVPKLIDAETSEFYVDPDKESSFADLKLAKILDGDNESFVIDPSGQSNLNTLSAEKIDAESIAVESLDTQLLNGSPPVNLGQLSGFAVTQLEAGTNIEVYSAGGQISGVGALTVGVVANPIFDNITTNSDATVGGSLDVGKDALIQGELTVEGDFTIEGSLNVELEDSFESFGNTTIGDESSDIFEINSTARFLSDLHVKNGSAITFINERTRIYAAENPSTLTIESSDNIVLSSKKIDISADEELNINAAKVVFDSSVDAQSNLYVSNDFEVKGNVVLGTSDSTITIESTIQGVTPLKFAGGDSSGDYILTLGDPTSDVKWFLPSQSGKLLVLPSSGLLSLPGNLKVKNSIAQDSTSDVNSFAGKVNVSNSVEISTDVASVTPLSITRNGKGEFISFSTDSGVSSFGLYGLSGAPTSAAAGAGSLAIDSSAGDLYIKRDVSSGWVRIVNDKEAFLQGGNAFSNTLQLGTTDAQSLELVTNGSKALSIDVSGDVELAGSLSIAKNLDIAADAQLKGDVALGDESTDTLTIAGIIQNDLLLAGTSGNTITLSRSAPTTDIQLALPSFSGTLLSMDATGDVALPGNLTVANGITQSNASSSNVINGAVTINNNLVVSATNEVAATFTRSNAGQVLSLSVDGGTNSFGLYGLSNDPSGDVTVASATRGSLAIDSANGQLHINTDGTSLGWRRLVHDQEVVVDGGNPLGTTVVIGSRDNFGLSFITNNVERLSIANTGAISLTNSMDVSGDIAVTGDVSTDGNLIVSGTASLNGAVSLGDESTDTLTIAGIIQNDLLLAGTSGNTITLSRSAPTTDIQLALPSFSGTLLSMDATGDVALPGNLTVANGITQSNASSSNVINGAVTINNNLVVSATNEVAATFTRNNAGQLLSLSVDGGTKSFGLYGLSNDPSGDVTVASATRGSLAIDSENGQLHINTDGTTSGWRRLVNDREAILNNGNTLGTTVVIGSRDNFGLSFITNNVERLSIANTGAISLTNSMDVSGDIAVTGDVSTDGNLIVSGTASLNGAVSLGDESTDTLTIAGIIQNDLLLAGISGNTITLSRSAPTTDIQLALPSFSGTLLSMDATGDVALPGNLTVANGITQSNASSSNVINGAVTINNNLVVSATNEVAATFTRSNAGQLLSLSVDGGTNSFGLYGLSNDPSGDVTVASATRGSLAIDSANGQLHINTDGTTSGWRRLVNDREAIVNNGNMLDTTVVIGSRDNFGLSFITNNVERLSIANTGAISLTNSMDVSGDVAVTGDVSTDGNLIVSGTASLNGAVSLGDESTDTLTIAGIIQNDLLLAGISGNTITLSRSAPTTDIQLALPSFSGTLLSMDATGDVALPGNLTVANGITQSNASSSNVINGAVTINNNLVVSATNEVAATFTRSNAGQVLSLSVDGGTNNFGLYGREGVPIASDGTTGSLAIDSSSGGLYVKDNTNTWLRLVTNNELVVNGGNSFGSTMRIGTDSTSTHGLSLITDNTDRLTISSTGAISITGDLTVGGVSTLTGATVNNDLTVAQNTFLNGNVVLGEDASSDITVNGTIQGGVSFRSSSGNIVTLTPSAPSSNIIVTLPSATGSLLATDASGNLQLAGGLTVAGAINQTDSASTNQLTGPVTINNALAVVAGSASRVASFSRANNGELLSFSVDGGTSSVGLFGRAGAPTAIDGTTGSLSIDSANGDLYVKNDTHGWLRLVADNEVVVDGGSNVDSTMKIGTTNAHGLSLITGGVSNDRLTISSTGAVGITGDLTVGGTSTLTGTTTINNDLTVAQNTSLNGNVVLGEDASSDITVNGVIQGGVSLRATNNNIVTLSPGVPSGNINVFLPATSGTLLVADGSGNLALTGRLSGTGVSISSGSNTSASFARDSDGQLLSFNIPANNFGLYGYSGAPSGGGNTGSLAIDTAAGDLYLRSGGNWSQVLTQGGNALSGTGGILSIGTSNSNSVALIANNNTALSIDAAGDITVSGKLKNNLVFDTAGTGDITLASSTVGSNITVTLPSAAGILLTDQDAISNIQDNTITNADLASGAFTKITSVGELTSLTVAGAVTAKSTLNVQGLLTAENGAAVSGDLSVTGGVTVGSLPTGSSSTNTLCASIAGELITCSSLGALKDDVQSLSLGMDTLLQLQPKQFTWKGDGKQDLGFIAEEVEAVNPLLAQYDGAGQLTGVKYRHLTALLTQAIQEQQTQLDNLGDVVVVNEGNMGVGKSAHDSFRLDVAGSIRGASFVESSDQRLKKNVESISDVLDGGVLSRLNQIDGVYYDWNNQYKQLNANVADVPQVGVLAQQVEQVLPRLVDTDSQGYKTVAYSKFVPYLVEGVKELSDQIEPLRQVVQSENGELSLQAKRLKLSDIVIESDSQDTLRIKRSTSLSSLLEISSTKVANEDAEGYVSTKDVYLADAKMWGSDMTSRIESVSRKPSAQECSNDSQKGDMRLVASSGLIYICSGSNGWLSTELSSS